MAQPSSLAMRRPIVEISDHRDHEIHEKGTKHPSSGFPIPVSWDGSVPSDWWAASVDLAERASVPLGPALHSYARH